MGSEAPDVVAERQEKEQQALISALREMPVIQVACKRAGVGRATYYRWRNEDEEFRKSSDEAQAEGEALITDMSESQLISLIRDKKFQAVHLWLRHHHPKYGDKIEVISRSAELEALTPEQDALVRKALKLAGLSKPRKHHEKKRTKP